MANSGARLNAGTRFCGRCGAPIDLLNAGTPGRDDPPAPSPFLPSIGNYNGRTLYRLARKGGALVREAYAVPGLRLVDSTIVGSELPPALPSGASGPSYAVEVFSPDGRLDARAQQSDGTGSVMVWDTSTGNQVAHMDLGSNFELNGTPAIAFSPNSQLFVAGTDGGAIKTWQVVGSSTS